MGREVRRVPKDWEHPKDERGNYVPMHERFTYNAEVEYGESYLLVWDEKQTRRISVHTPHPLVDAND